MIQVAPRCFQTVGNLSDIYFLNVLCCGWAHNSTWAPRYINFGEKVSQNHANTSQIRLWAGLPASRNPIFFKIHYPVLKSSTFVVNRSYELPFGHDADTRMNLCLRQGVGSWLGGSVGPNMRWSVWTKDFCNYSLSDCWSESLGHSHSGISTRLRFRVLRGLTANSSAHFNYTMSCNYTTCTGNIGCLK